MHTLQRKPRTTKKGVVLSNKMEKTVVVRVSTVMRHKEFGKVVTRLKKYYAHCEEKLAVGTSVVISQTRPLSKLKRWRVLSADAVEIAQ